MSLSILLFIGVLLLAFSNCCYATIPSAETCIAFESSYHIERACECLVYESYGGTHGSFTSIRFPLIYPVNVSCILYTFIGDEGELVEINFIDFDLQQPTANKCNDYVHLYVDLERPEVSDSQLPSTTLCGDTSGLHQTTFYSSTRSLILEFHTNSVQTNQTGFRGTFRFLEKAQFELQGGTRRWDTQCTYDFYSAINSTKSGRIFSPRFPQFYPPQSFCYYHFHALPGERVQIQFSIIDLETTDPRCSVKRDVITVRDGSNSSAAVLARYCGRHHPSSSTSPRSTTTTTPTTMTLLSSGLGLLVEFVSDKAVERQGFAAIYQFVTAASVAHLQQQQPSLPSNHQFVSSLKPPTPHADLASRPTKFPPVDLNTHDPRDSPMMHVPYAGNTSPETSKQYVCNDRYVSDSKTTRTTTSINGGTITSPFYPKPYGPDTDCLYVFQGQRYERVRLVFSDFDLLSDSTDMPLLCEGYDSLTIYELFRGVRRDIGVYCGRKIQSAFMSADNILEVRFVSRPTSSLLHSQQPATPRGFSATYSFVTNFGITTGDQQTDVNGTYVCQFVYKSAKSMNGTFTSPNYPGLYPRNTECHYLFYGDDWQRVVITFRHFDVEGLPPHCKAEDLSDYVEFSNFNIQLSDRKMLKFCSQLSSHRSQITSDGAFFRVTFKSNEVYDGVGFDAQYEFQQLQPDHVHAGERVMSRNSARRRTFSTTTWSVTWTVVIVIVCLLYPYCYCRPIWRRPDDCSRLATSVSVR